MKKRYLLFILSSLFGIILFVWIVKTIGYQPIKEVFSTITFCQTIIIFILSLLIPLLEGYRWKEILKIQNKEISLKDSFRLGVSSFSINFLAPILVGSAELFRGYFLKKTKNYSGTQIAPSIIIDRIIGWTTDALFVVFGLIFFFYNTEVIPQNSLINVGYFFIFLVSALAFFYYKVFKKESIISSISNILNDQIENVSVETERSIFAFFGTEKKRILKPFLISFIKNLIMCLRIWLLLIFINGKISFLSILSILTFTYLAILIPVPASLGSHELFQVFVFNSLTMESSLAVAFTMIIRGVDFLSTILGLFFLFHIGSSFLKKHFIENK